MLFRSLIENLLAYGTPVDYSPQKLSLPEKIPAERHTIDTPATALVGRAEQIEDIGIRIMESRLVTLIGMGGVGKTRLAIEVGLKLASNYLCGVVFVDFSDFLSSSAEEELSNALLESLKITALSGESPHETLVRNLQNQEILIVLDNCEHLLNSVAKLCKFLLLNTNYLRILATSRERIRIVEERSFVVKELSTPLSGGVYDIETLRESEAISLLVQRMQANRPDFDLNNENANDLLEICQKLEGNALGIELAAGMLAEIEPSALVKGLQESFWTLDDQGDRTRPERYNSLRAMIAWSYRLLTPDEASLFQELSLLSAGWSYEAALAIRTPISNELSLMSLLTSLLTKSLILTVSTWT